MSHAFVVTECTRVLIRNVIWGIVDHILNLKSFERRVSVTISFQYPANSFDSQNYFRHIETLHAGPVLEDQVLESLLGAAIKCVNPYANPHFHCSTVRGMTVAGLSEPDVPQNARRVMIISVWAPGDTSSVLARDIAFHAPEMWDDVLRLLYRDAGLS
ncbi:hypothetical protein KC902_00750 [Candidatus Kaiserbacteria bacterium]|nr:hypothetical protein [Candidatus Kaiserbacteria bacterium]